MASTTDGATVAGDPRGSIADLPQVWASSVSTKRELVPAINEVENKTDFVALDGIRPPSDEIQCNFTVAQVLNTEPHNRHRATVASGCRRVVQKRK